MAKVNRNPLGAPSKEYKVYLDKKLHQNAEWRYLAGLRALERIEAIVDIGQKNGSWDSIKDITKKVLGEIR